jgi:hypothetical protein
MAADEFPDEVDSGATAGFDWLALQVSLQIFAERSRRDVALLRIPT